MVCKSARRVREVLDNKKEISESCITGIWLYVRSLAVSTTIPVAVTGTKQCDLFTGEGISNTRLRLAFKPILFKVGQEGAAVSACLCSTPGVHWYRQTPGWRDTIGLQGFSHFAWVVLAARASMTAKEAISEVLNCIVCGVCCVRGWICGCVDVCVDVYVSVLVLVLLMFCLLEEVIKRFFYRSFCNYLHHLMCVLSLFFM